MRTIYQNNGFRIVEIADLDWDMADLKGDCYDPSINTDLDPESLKVEEKRFEAQVNKVGVYGYTLQEWNPEVGKGWEETNNSCWGFVGQYDENSKPQWRLSFHEVDCNHYIVREFKQIAEENA